MSQLLVTGAGLEYRAGVIFARGSDTTTVSTRGFFTDCFGAKVVEKNVRLELQKLKARRSPLNGATVVTALLIFT
jgi:hypothetical protein